MLNLPRATTEVLVMIAAALAALSAIGHYTRKGIRIVMSFFRRIEKALTNVEKQLYPNGGASLRDAVNRIQEHLGIDDITHDEHDDTKDNQP